MHGLPDFRDNAGSRDPEAAAPLSRQTHSKRHSDGRLIRNARQPAAAVNSTKLAGLPEIAAAAGLCLLNQPIKVLGATPLASQTLICVPSERSYSAIGACRSASV